MSTVQGTAHDKNRTGLQWTVRCDLLEHYEAPTATCPGEDWLEIAVMYEAEFEVHDIDGRVVIFYLYDYGSLMDYLDLWGVDMAQALDDWEPPA